MTATILPSWVYLQRACILTILKVKQQPTRWFRIGAICVDFRPAWSKRRNSILRSTKKQSTKVWVMQQSWLSYCVFWHEHRVRSMWDFCCQKKTHPRDPQGLRNTCDLNKCQHTMFPQHALPPVATTECIQRDRTIYEPRISLQSRSKLSLYDMQAPLCIQWRDDVTANLFVFFDFRKLLQNAIVFILDMSRFRAQCSLQKPGRHDVATKSKVPKSASFIYM